MTTKEFEKGRINLKGTETKDFKGTFEIFSKENLGSVRTVLANDEIWFSGKDACKILGIKNHKQALERLDPEEVGMFYTPHPQSPKKEVLMNFVTESGLYELIFRSNKPEAKIFKQWITKEVIPTIRKHGYYSNVPQIDERDRAKLAVVNAASEEERMIAFGIYQEKFVIPMQKELEVARPKAETYDEFLDADGTITSTTLAISFGLQSARLFNELMHHYGVIARVGKSWRPSQKYINEGIMKAVEFGYNPHKKKNENSPLLLENKLDKTNENSTEIATLNSDDIASNEKETKGVMFKWTLTGLEVAKRILLENGYVEKINDKYIANSEKIAEFKKNYKKAK